jgi:hypothetical protein
MHRDQHRRRRVPVYTRQNIITTVLIVFILLSTIVNALTLGAVYRVRQVLRGQLEAATRNVAAVREQTFRYDIAVDETFPISTTVHIDERLDIPINMQVPIREQVTVPIGPIEFPVDLNMDVPISTTVPVHIVRDLPVSTSIDLRTDVPIEIDLGQAPIGDVLKELENALRELLEQL